MDEVEVVQETPVVTNEDLARRLDMFGEQMNWLVENFDQLFKFIAAMGQQGGGLRGLLSMMKNGGPDLTTIPADSTESNPTND